MKKLLFTLAALMMMGTAYADNIITMPDQDLTAEQLGTEVQIRMSAEFENYVSAFRLIFTGLPDGVTVTQFSWGNGAKITYLNADGDEETGFRPSLMTNYQNETGPLAMAASQEMAYLEDGTYGGVAHWSPGSHADFLRVKFAIAADFAGGQVTWTVEPSAGGWGDHSNDCPKNSFHTVSCYFNSPAAPQPQTLAGEIVFGEIDAETGLISVSYNGEENVTLTATLNGEAVEIVDGNIQLVEGENTVVVTATADGYEPKVANGVFVWTAPLPPVQTPAPVINVTPGEDAYTFLALGEGTVTMYLDEQEVSNPYVVGRTEVDQVVKLTAIAHVDGQIDGTLTAEYVVPALAPVEEPLSGDIEVGEVDPETGLLPVGYNGNEAGVTVTVTVNGEPVEVVDGLVQLAEGDNTVVVTVSGDGYETMTETFDVNWTKPVGPEDPHMTGYWLVVIDAQNNLNWFQLTEGSNGDYATTVGLDCATYGDYVPNEDDSNRPSAAFYFVVDGVVYGSEFEEQPTVLGDAMANPLFANSENCYTVFTGFNYTLGIAIDGDNYYVYASKAGGVGIDELVDGKTVANVRYFNMAGQEMQEANGMTIVVTTYTDGTTSAVKVMK